uniref:Uncharacterized protein n=1 Tax=Romanomermis culicivorax TaxID=13658 RepID=A0A915J4Y2_ROMCU
VENEGDKPRASIAVEREDDNAILSRNQDHVVKILSTTNHQRRGDLLQLPISGLGHPMVKVNILVMDQHQCQLMNKPAQLFDRYH